MYFVNLLKFQFDKLLLCNPQPDGKIISYTLYQFENYEIKTIDDITIIYKDKKLLEKCLNTIKKD
jgi:hypothetical protein